MNKYVFIIIGSHLLASPSFGMTPDKSAPIETSHVPRSDKTEIVPVFKTLAKEDLVTRFNYATTHLLDTVKNDKQAFDIIDVEKLEDELLQHANILKDNSPEQLNDTPFTRITLPLLNNDLSSIRKISAFVLDNIRLRENLWYVPYNYNRRFPTLEFIPDLTLCYRCLSQTPEIYLNEQLLALLMSGIEMDLLTAPNVRGRNVSVNTRLLFDFFQKCKNENNEPEKKINMYQKYLTQEQNNILTLQLLSVYLETPFIYNSKNYMFLLCQRLFMNTNYGAFVPLIDNQHHTIVSIFQKYLQLELHLCADSIGEINKFVTDVLTFAPVNNEKNPIQIEFIPKFSTYLRAPIIEKFKLLKVIFEKNGTKYSNRCNQFFKNFVKTMCKGNCYILFRVLNHFNYHKILAVRKIMNV